MAVDTRDKRSNCLNVANPWKFSAPNPDGTLATQADRQHIAYVYRGILIGGQAHTATASLTAPKATLSASAESADPVFSATSALTTPKATISASGTTTEPTVSGTAALTAPKAILVGIGDYQDEPFAGTSALTSPKATLAANASNEQAVEASSALTTPKATLAATATFEQYFVGASVLTSPKAILAATGDYQDEPQVGTCVLVTPAAILVSTGIAGEFAIVSSRIELRQHGYKVHLRASDMTIKMHQRPVIGVGDVRVVSVDMTDELDTGVSLTGVPTVSVSPAGPTFDNQGINSAAINVLDRSVSSGKAVQFRITGGLVLGTTYTITVTCGTNGTPPETFQRKFDLRCV